MNQKSLTLLIFAILAGGMWFQHNQNQQNMLELRREIARSSNRPAPSQDGKAAVDPYQAKQVKNTLTKQSKNLQSCYLDYLKSSPKQTKGQVKLDWQITKEGTVLDAGVVFNAFQNKNLSECLVKKLASIHFPPPPYGNHYIEHSLYFQTEADFNKAQAERGKLQRLGP